MNKTQLKKYELIPNYNAKIVLYSIQKIHKNLIVPHEIIKHTQKQLLTNYGGSSYDSLNSTSIESLADISLKALIKKSIADLIKLSHEIQMAKKTQQDETIKHYLSELKNKSSEIRTILDDVVNKSELEEKNPGILLMHMIGKDNINHIIRAFPYSQYTEELFHAYNNYHRADNIPVRTLSPVWVSWVKQPVVKALTDLWDASNKRDSRLERSTYIKIDSMVFFSIHVHINFIPKPYTRVSDILTGISSIVIRVDDIYCTTEEQLYLALSSLQTPKCLNENEVIWLFSVLLPYLKWSEANKSE